MSNDNDTKDIRQAAAIFADALSKAFAEWSEEPEIRRFVRESIAGRIPRRQLMKLAHSVGCKHGQQAAAACFLADLTRRLSLPPTATHADCLAEITRLRDRETTSP